MSALSLVDVEPDRGGDLHDRGLAEVDVGGHQGVVERLVEVLLARSQRGPRRQHRRLAQDREILVDEAHVGIVLQHRDDIRRTVAAVGAAIVEELDDGDDRVGRAEDRGPGVVVDLAGIVGERLLGGIGLPRGLLLLVGAQGVDHHLRMLGQIVAHDGLDLLLGEIRRRIVCKRRTQGRDGQGNESENENEPADHGASKGRAFLPAPFGPVNSRTRQPGTRERRRAGRAGFPCQSRRR